MSTQASVQSIDNLRDLRAVLATFAEEVLGALGAVEMDIRRNVQWLQHDQRAYWQSEIKRRKEKLSQARAELAKKKMSQMFGHSAAYSEAIELVRKCDARLQDAEKKAALVKKYEPVLQQAILEYHGRTRRLADLAGGDIERALAKLAGMIDALDAYTHIAAPSSAAPVVTSSGGESAPAPVASSAPTESAAPAGGSPPASGDEAQAEGAP